ncbi:hypothetical protein ACWDAZ_36855 [Streptomyces sp. NPDC001215]
MTAEALVLVEPGAHRPGGHRDHALTALAAAYGNTVVVAPFGIAAQTRAALLARALRAAPGADLTLNIGRGEGVPSCSTPRR